jgi:hypothetical protein
MGFQFGDWSNNAQLTTGVATTTTGPSVNETVVTAEVADSALATIPTWDFRAELSLSPPMPDAISDAPHAVSPSEFSLSRDPPQFSPAPGASGSPGAAGFAVPATPQYRFVPIAGHNWWFVVPLWAPMIVFGIVPALWIPRYLRLRRRAERLRKNLCLNCGYDLRSSLDRCPECGRVVAPQQGNTQLKPV